MRGVRHPSAKDFHAQKRGVRLREESFLFKAQAGQHRTANLFVFEPPPEINGETGHK